MDSPGWADPRRAARTVDALFCKKHFLQEAPLLYLQEAFFAISTFCKKHLLQEAPNLS